MDKGEGFPFIHIRLPGHRQSLSLAVWILELACLCLIYWKGDEEIGLVFCS